MAPTPPADVAAVAVATRQVLGANTANVQQTTAGLWRAMRGDLSQQAINQFVTAATPLVLGGMKVTAQLTTASVAAQTGQEQIESLGLEELAGLRDGVTPSHVLARPAVRARTMLADGATTLQAFESADWLLNLLIATYMQLAFTHQSQRSMAGSGVQFYQRIPRTSGACMLCLIASTQRYRVKDLMPIHPGCHCVSGPLPPGRHSLVLDQDLLDRVHAAVADAGFNANSSAKGYQHLVAVQQNGELGPVLTRAGQHFTGPDDIRLNTRPPRLKKPAR